jgi:hypothetical protein
MTKSQGITVLAVAFSVFVALILALSILLIVARFFDRSASPAREEADDIERISLDTVYSSEGTIYSSRHYQAILDLPSSIYVKSEQDVCGICLFEFEPGDPVKTIPSCKHFFHGLHYTYALVECVSKMICKSRFGLSCDCKCPLCRSPIAVENDISEVVE